MHKALQASSRGEVDPAERRLTVRFGGPCLAVGRVTHQMLRRVSEGDDLPRGSQVQVVGCGLYICRSRLSLQPIHFGSMLATVLGEASAPGHTQIGNAESASSLSQAVTGWVCWGKLGVEALGLSGASPPTCTLSSLLFYGYLMHNSCPLQPAPGMPCK